MKEGKTSRRTALAGLASRLRMRQAECADQTDAQRMQFLDEEIGQSLEAVLPQDRAAFLEDLRAYFPAWQSMGESSSPSTGISATTAPTTGAAPLDAVAHAEGLAKLAAGLSDDRKAQIARHLAKFGYITPASAATATGPVVPVGTSATVKEILGITSNDPLDVPKALEAMAVLAQFSSDLDQVAWDTWKQIAPVNSPIRKQVDLKSALSGFVVADPKAPKARVSTGVESLRLLIAALTASIPLAGKTASSEFRKFSAEKVEEAVTADGGRGWNFEKRCWQKYKDLSEAARPGLEAAVRKEIAQVVEDWMKKAR